MTAADPVLVELGAAIDAALAAADLPAVDDPAFERPRDPDHGDWASTLALRLAKPARMAPRAIADAVVANLTLPAAVDAVEVAGPGFLNFRLSSDHASAMVRDILDRGTSLRTPEPTGTKVNLEFVSANPTGPLHVGHGRWAAVGDALAALLRAAGTEVSTEYYLNDAGGQVITFGETVTLTARGEVLDDNHYQGDYIAAIVTRLRDQWGDEIFSEQGPVDLPDELRELGSDAVVADEDAPHGGPADAGGRVAGGELPADGRVPPQLALRVGVLASRQMQEMIASTLRDMGVEFDHWFSERQELHASGLVAEALDALAELGVTYEQGGALFLRTSEHGDDKDRVLVKADGAPTYFAADCAYMRDKFSRADHLIYLLGADHHGYVGRLRAAAACLGIPDDSMELRIGQLVNLLRDGEPLKMSKRAGTFVELADVVDEVGSDVTRYHFLRSGLDTAIDFDLVRVAAQSMDNPVYYVQYAHARISSLLAKADERDFDPGAAADADMSILDHPAEADLLREMGRVNEVVAEAADLRATQRVARYAEELAATFHRFYTECRVLGEGIDPAVSRARYHLAAAARQVLADVLGLLRVSAPERM